MDNKGSLLQWKLSLPESLAMAATVATVVLWSTAKFQDKNDATEIKRALEERVSRLELEISNLRHDVTDIAKDTNYIRGRLEPKTR